MTLNEWMLSAQARMADSPDAAADAMWITEETLSLPRAKIRLERSRVLSASEISRLDGNLTRRLDGEPVQYIFSRAPFMGFEFYVDRRVLIPRMDTETLCEAAYGYIRKLPAPRVLDLCAGSGAIGLSLKRMKGDISLTLSDISPDAGKVQAINAEGLDGVRILTGDMFSTVDGEKFDLIVCNPPYIRSEEIPSLQREVLREPFLALDGGHDGLKFYRILSDNYRARLKPGGRIYMEIGYDQAGDVSRLFPEAKLIRDLNGQPRVIWTEV